MSIVDTVDEIKGHIYIIKNKLSDKKYIGQTLSHRMNHGKYRLFGYEGRFRDHISEAICNTKKKQCSYLNNAIRQFGRDAFYVELIEECTRSEMDERERYYISLHNTLYPTGYNLTNGGKGQRYIKTTYSENPDINKSGKRGGCNGRSLQTRLKISEQLKKTFAKESVRSDLMKRAQNQHMSDRLLRFNSVRIDILNIDKYIHNRKNRNMGEYVKVVVDNISTTFVGKHEPIEVHEQRARDFLQNVYYATLSTCSGKP